MSAKISYVNGNVEIDENDLVQLSIEMQKILTIKDRKYHFKTYPDCFLGTDAVQYFISHNIVENENDGVLLGQKMMENELLYHVTKDQTFKNKEYFYRFYNDDDHGKEVLDEKGAKISWAKVSAFLPDIGNDVHNLNTDYEATKDENMICSKIKDLRVSPMDEHNTVLLDHVHPAKWINPKAKSYTLVVIGAGAGGLVSSAIGAGVGASVAIIEEHLMGGDCLNVGCVPSKALIRSATAVKTIRNAEQYGVYFENELLPKVRFDKVMERLRKIRAEIAVNDSYARYSKTLGVDVFQGRASFISSNEVQVNGDQVLKFNKAIIATGASAAVPNISGISDVEYLTNATIFNLIDLPPKIIVIGAGPIGLELAQAFARFGAKVTCFVRGDKLLPKEDRDAAKIVQEELVEDGIDIYFKTTYDKIESAGPDGHVYNAPFGQTKVCVTIDGEAKEFTCDALLIATGRAPNVANLGLEEAGVEYDGRKGVQIDDYMRTSNKSIFAVGDVCTKFQFTHVADWMARGAVRNALFFGSSKMSSLLIPWATYTEPEIAHVGLYESDMKARNIEFDTYTKHFSDIDRAICDGETKGFVKIHCKKGKDTILGATIVNANAGNMISEITMAMQHKIGLSRVAPVIHPYPTQSDAIRACGDLFGRTRLTPGVKGLLSKIANRSLT